MSALWILEKYFGGLLIFFKVVIEKYSQDPSIPYWNPLCCGECRVAAAFWLVCPFLLDLLRFDRGQVQSRAICAGAFGNECM